jgi:hypothetical protein
LPAKLRKSVSDTSVAPHAGAVSVTEPVHVSVDVLFMPRVVTVTPPCWQLTGVVGPFPGLPGLMKGTVFVPPKLMTPCCVSWLVTEKVHWKLLPAGALAGHDLITARPVMCGTGVGVCPIAGNARRSAASGRKTPWNKRRETLRGQFIVLFVLLSDLMALIPTFQQWESPTAIAHAILMLL